MATATATADKAGVEATQGLEISPGSNVDGFLDYTHKPSEIRTTPISIETRVDKHCYQSHAISGGTYHPTQWWLPYKPVVDIGARPMSIRGKHDLKG